MSDHWTVVRNKKIIVFSNTPSEKWQNLWAFGTWWGARTAHVSLAQGSNSMHYRLISMFLSAHAEKWYFTWCLIINAQYGKVWGNTMWKDNITEDKESCTVSEPHAQPHRRHCSFHMTSPQTLPYCGTLTLNIVPSLTYYICHGWLPYLSGNEQWSTAGSTVGVHEKGQLCFLNRCILILHESIGRLPCSNHHSAAD